MLCSPFVNFWSGSGTPASADASADDIITADAVTLDLARRRALVDGHVVHLPYAEAAILDVLMRRAGTTVYLAALSETLPSSCGDPGSTVDRLVRRLGRRLTPTPLTVPRIHRGEGHSYRFGLAA